jgi:hypothetical protein
VDSKAEDPAVLVQDKGVAKEADAARFNKWGLTVRIRSTLQTWEKTKISPTPAGHSAKRSLPTRFR